MMVRCQRIYECLFLEILANLLAKLQFVNSKIFVAIIQALIEELCADSSNKFFFLVINKDPLRSRVCETSPAPVLVSVQVLSPCRER
jgi:hypothetical protein